MGKQLIERIAPLVQAALEQDYLFPAQGGRKSLAESITALVIARIDAERWKDAVAFRMIDGDDVEYNGIDQFSCGRTGGEPLFLSPTIPEGWSISRSSRDYDLGQDVLKQDALIDVLDLCERFIIAEASDYPVSSKPVLAAITSHRKGIAK